MSTVPPISKEWCQPKTHSWNVTQAGLYRLLCTEYTINLDDDANVSMSSNIPIFPWVQTSLWFKSWHFVDSMMKWTYLFISHLWCVRIICTLWSNITIWIWLCNEYMDWDTFYKILNDTEYWNTAQWAKVSEHFDFVMEKQRYFENIRPKYGETSEYCKNPSKSQRERKIPCIFDDFIKIHFKNSVRNSLADDSQWIKKCKYLGDEYLPKRFRYIGMNWFRYRHRCINWFRQGYQSREE